MLQGGNVWEKAGCNLSVVYGSMPPEALQAATERGVDRAKGMKPGTYRLFIQRPAYRGGWGEGLGMRKGGLCCIDQCPGGRLTSCVLCRLAWCR